MLRVQRFIYRSLSTRISPLAYLMVWVSWAIGFFFGFLQFLPDVQNTLLAKYGILGNPRLWGFALLIFSTISIFGMRSANRSICKLGSMGTFILWGFAAILYISNSFWYAFFTFALFHMICHGYMYLVSALDSLWDQRVR